MMTPSLLSVFNLLILYLSATEETTGKACPYSTDPITEYRSGEDARLFYKRSIRENVEDFLAYRAYAHSSLFAFMKQYESEGTCSGPLTEICLKRKIEFRKWNQTHLMIKIYDVTISDSGLYKVWARFRGLQTDEKTKKCLQVIHLEKKEPQSTRVYSTSSMKSSGPQSSQYYSTFTIKGSGPQLTPDYSTTTMKSSGPQSTQIHSTTSMKSSGPRSSQDYSTITRKGSGPQPTQHYSTTTIKSSGPQSTQDHSITTMKCSGPRSTQDYSTISMKSSEPKVSMAPTSSVNKQPYDSTWMTVSVVLGSILGLLLLVLVVKGRGIICVRQTLPYDRCLLKPEEMVSTAAIAMPNPQYSDQVRQDNTLHGGQGIQQCANIELVDRTPLLTTLQEEKRLQHERCTAAPYKIPRPENSSVSSDSKGKVAQGLLNVSIRFHENRGTATSYKIPRPANPSLASDSKGCIELERLHNNFCSQGDNCSTCKNPRTPNSSIPSNFKGESLYTPVQSSNDWEVPCESLKLFKKIGGGQFGQVWKGEAKDVGHTHGWSDVAVKMLKEKSSPSDLQDLWYELNLLKKLQAEAHPNVVQLLGCLTKDIFRCEGREFRPPLVILEFVPYGDLLGYLKKRREEIDDSPRKISTEQLYKFASDIARGMAFISAQKLIHRDLAARNILVGEGLRCKITDLGMTRHGGEAQIYVRKSKGPEPLRWMAVESLEGEVFTTKSDVWSYGIVLYEIFTLGDYPYSEMNGHKVYKYVTDGHRLKRPSRVSPELYDLMLQCWDQAPSRRPTFESIATWMETYTHHQCTDNRNTSQIKSTLQHSVHQ